MARVLFNPFFIGGGGGRVAVYGYEYDYLFFYHCPPKYGHPPPPLLIIMLKMFMGVAVLFEGGREGGRDYTRTNVAVIIEL